jgi:hypothetical protein
MCPATEFQFTSVASHSCTEQAMSGQPSSCEVSNSFKFRAQRPQLLKTPNLEVSDTTEA